MVVPRAAAGYARQLKILSSSGVDKGFNLKSHQYWKIFYPCIEKSHCTFIGGAKNSNPPVLIGLNLKSLWSQNLPHNI